MEERRKIGRFIAELRERAGMTQKDLADAIRTSQSAVARMERGEQNLTTGTLSKISRALKRDVIALGGDAVNFRIEGGRKLAGVVETNVSKNAAVGLLCAALLNRGTTVLKGMPKIEEVFRIIEVLESIGVEVRWVDKDIEITPPREFRLDRFNAASAIKTRSVLMLMGPLVHAARRFRLPHPGGCKLGRRTVRPHLFALEKFGIRIETDSNDYRIAAERLHAEEIVLYESGDTVTENALMAAAKIPGKTVIKYASANYQVQDMCHFLEALGVRIEGIGTTTLTVHGVREIRKRVEFTPGEDPIEAMMFLSLAATTGSAITVKRCPIDFLDIELLKLEKMGFRYEIAKRYVSANGYTRLVDIRTKPSKLSALEEKIYARPYPGLNIDNLPFFVPIATQAKGTTLIHDWVYENRAIYYMELAKLGANIILADPHRVFIKGPTELKAAEIVCPPALRPAVVIMIAMLAAKGTSVLRNVYSINRGYEDLAERLQKLGAKIEILRGI